MAARGWGGLVAGGVSSPAPPPTPPRPRHQDGALPPTEPTRTLPQPSEMAQVTASVGEGWWEGSFGATWLPSHPPAAPKPQGHGFHLAPVLTLPAPPCGWHGRASCLQRAEPRPPRTRSARAPAPQLSPRCRAASWGACVCRRPVPTSAAFSFMQLPSGGEKRDPVKPRLPNAKISVCITRAFPGF